MQQVIQDLQGPLAHLVLRGQQDHRGLQGQEQLVLLVPLAQVDLLALRGLELQGQQGRQGRQAPLVLLGLVQLVLLEQQDHLGLVGQQGLVRLAHQALAGLKV